MDLEKTIKKYQEILRLQDWDIVLVADETINSEASMLTIYNSYKGVMKVKPNLCEEEQEKAIIHELLHLIYRDAYDIFSENIEDSYIKEYCNRQHERAIEKTAQIIYRLIHSVE